MPKHYTVKMAKKAEAEIRRLVKEKTKNPQEREILLRALETPFTLLSQGEEELQLLIKYYHSGQSERSEMLTYLSNLQHCIGTSVGHIMGFSI